MPWTAPPITNWVDDVGITSAFMQAVSDDLIYLLGGRLVGSKTASISGSTASTTFVDIDAANAIITQTLTSSRCVVVCHLAVALPLAATLALDCIVDSTTRSSGSAAGGVGLINQTNASGATPWVTWPTLYAYFSGLSIASHTFKPQWRVSGGTGTLPTQQHTMWLFEV